MATTDVIFATAVGSGTSSYGQYTSQVYCGYGKGTGAYKARLTFPTLSAYKNYTITSLILSVANSVETSSSYNTGREAVNFVFDPSSNAFSSSYSTSSSTAASNGGFTTSAITSSKDSNSGNVTRYLFDLTSYASQITAFTSTFYIKMWDNGSISPELPHVYRGPSESGTTMRPRLLITYEPAGLIQYGDTTWKSCEVYYGVDGVWMKSDVYYGNNNAWTRINNG